MTKQLAICLLTLLSVSGCSLLTKTSTSPEVLVYDWQKTRASLEEFDHWSIYGKLGLRSPSNNFTAAINQWRQTSDRYAIDISSTFFGLGSSKLLGTSEILTIIESEEAPISSDKPDALVKEALGLPLPLQHLTHWIKGLAAPIDKFNIEFGENGLPKALHQSGWDIEFSKHKEVAGRPLPHKIKLSRANTKITLAIKEWTALKP